MIINIAPIGNVDKGLIKYIEDHLSRYYNFSTQELKLNLDIKKFYSEERRQYYSTQIIQEAAKFTGNVKDKVLILFEDDLFVPVFTYIFGEAQFNGKHAIVSLCRLHEEFYTGKTNQKLFFERTLKEVLHELGHTFNLKHCHDWDCLMHTSGGIEEVDIKGSGFCVECSKSIP
ncbi:MAG: archaemetzincin family Zn-dependent metalloprotease [Melioribacteraceae bacterium]|nr:archaemetzincin family Zn-dependent metalloprotease [Melioribacteraceae bacterium]MCF8263687.1 archaemetzincin family Zn-dependent metalloprotease [Melioribacteraceae bacterium]MCF8414374.1 archaemetzincin family Zn-dependent metalloprotease [Melioribacteraceae bacterium]MCF8431066.1 archaemetzincin family Zn-dependent metalloprotease [Melioribacteraceae bacterium]